MRQALPAVVVQRPHPWQRHCSRALALVAALAPALGLVLQPLMILVKVLQLGLLALALALALALRLLALLRGVTRVTPWMIELSMLLTTRTGQQWAAKRDLLRRLVAALQQADMRLAPILRVPME